MDRSSKRDEHTGLPVYLIHWRAPEWCRSAVASIVASDCPVAVTIIDNGGLDGPVPGARILRQPTNRGYTGAANVALADWARTFDCEFCVIASHDLQVETSTLRQLLEYAATDPRIGVAAPELGRTGARGPHITDDCYVWVSGTCMLLRRGCRQAIGGFDEIFRTYGEDVDLCVRARQAGWRVVIVPSARARGSGSAHGHPRRLRFSNQPLFAAKHQGTLAGARVLIAQPLLAVMYAWRAIRSRTREDRREALGMASDRIAAVPTAAVRLAQLYQARRRSGRVDADSGWFTRPSVWAGGGSERE